MATPLTTRSPKRHPRILDPRILWLLVLLELVGLVLLGVLVWQRHVRVSSGEVATRVHFAPCQGPSPVTPEVMSAVNGSVDAWVGAWFEEFELGPTSEAALRSMELRTRMHLNLAQAATLADHGSEHEHRTVQREAEQRLQAAVGRVMEPDLAQRFHREWRASWDDAWQQNSPEPEGER